MMHHTVGLAAVGRAGLGVEGGGGGAAAGVGSSHDGATGFDAAAGLGALGIGGVADAELGPCHGLSITPEFGHFYTYWPGVSPKFVKVNGPNRCVVCAHRSDRFELPGLLLVRRIVRPRCTLNAFHNEGGGDIRLCMSLSKKCCTIVNKHTSFRALITICVPLRKRATALECESTIRQSVECVEIIIRDLHTEQSLP